MGFAEREQTGMDLRVQRSGREGAVVGLAAQKQAGMDLRVQRSGWERVAVGFARRGRAETDGREQGKRCPGPAKRTKDGYGRRRCSETSRNVPAGAAKRIRGGCCGPRCVGT